MDDLCRNVFDGKNPVAVTLEQIRPGAQYTVRGYTLDDVEWMSTNTSQKPSQDEFDAALEATILKQKGLNTWLPQRVQAYPTIQQQLDMLYWDQVNGTSVWADTIAAIKQKFPKGS